MVSNSHNKQRWREPLLPFAERAYALPPVENWCLTLQDKYHVNVNILLWTLWLQKESLRISSYWLDDVLISVDTTSQLTVNRLRELRRIIKHKSNFTKVQSQQVCKHILNAEISAERILLGRLQDLSSRFLDSKSFTDSSEYITPEYYLSFLGVQDIDVPLREIRSHISIMRSAVRQ